MFAFFLGRQVLSPRHSQDELTGKSSAPHNLHSTLISLLSCVHPAVLQGEDELDFLIPNGPMCKLRLGEGQGVPQVPRSYCTTGKEGLGSQLQFSSNTLTADPTTSVQMAEQRQREHSSSEGLEAGPKLEIDKKSGGMEASTQ